MKTYALVIGSLLMATLAHGQVIRVPEAYSTIQQAINEASEGTTILVDPGTYFENLYFKGKNITLASLFLPTGDTAYISGTILSGTEQGYVVSFSGAGSTPTLCGFTIRNGSRGGIACDGAGPSLDHLIVADNGHHSVSHYGGIYCRNKSGPVITNSIISGNHSHGIQPGTGEGGGINCRESSLIVSKTTVTGNDSPEGGGICLYHSTALFESLVIAGNEASNGGGIRCDGSAFTMINGIISGNLASADGGGILCCNSSSPVFINLTLEGNSAAGQGGGIMLQNGSNPSFINSILYDDLPEEACFSVSGTANTLSLKYCDIEGGSGNILTNGNGSVIWLEGNLHFDPRFSGTGTYGLNLTGESPCIDAGNPDTAGLRLPPWDLSGNRRIWDGNWDGLTIIDMGAYEYGSPVSGTTDLKGGTGALQLTSYPNPFLASTCISYDLPQAVQVSLKVYDHLGRLVCVLTDETQGPGNHRIVLEAGSLQPGVYFCIMNTSIKIIAEKILKL